MPAPSKGRKKLHVYGEKKEKLVSEKVWEVLGELSEVQRKGSYSFGFGTHVPRTRGKVPAGKEKKL